MEMDLNQIENELIVQLPDGLNHMTTSAPATNLRNMQVQYQ
jgi:hypothetical protein